MRHRGSSWFAFLYSGLVFVAGSHLTSLDHTGPRCTHLDLCSLFCTPHACVCTLSSGSLDSLSDGSLLDAHRMGPLIVLADRFLSQFFFFLVSGFGPGLFLSHLFQFSFTVSHSDLCGCVYLWSLFRHVRFMVLDMDRARFSRGSSFAVFSGSFSHSLRSTKTPRIALIAHHRIFIAVRAYSLCSLSHMRWIARTWITVPLAHGSHAVYTFSGRTFGPHWIHLLPLHTSFVSFSRSDHVIAYNIWMRSQFCS